MLVDYSETEYKLLFLYTGKTIEEMSDDDWQALLSLGTVATYGNDYFMKQQENIYGAGI